MKSNFEQYIRSVKLEAKGKSEYPYGLNAVKSLSSLELHPSVTFIIGENGSGKSTLLEAIAVAYGFNAEGGTKNFNFATQETHSSLAESIQLVKGVRRSKDGFFLRAESFYNVATTIDRLDKEGFGPPIIDSYGGISLHKQSHGESFMSLILNRFSGNGLYILDEPEAALSPTRQMALLSRIHDLVKLNSQFIIATHSPIVMAYPNAIIYNVDEGYKEVSYKETEHYQVVKEFVNQPERLLKILLDE